MKNKGTVLPPKFKVVTSFEWFRKFTWRERLLIALGFNFNVMVRFFTVHRTGAWHASAEGKLSMHSTSKDHASNEAPEPPIPTKMSGHISGNVE